MMHALCAKCMRDCGHIGKVAAPAHSLKSWIESTFPDQVTVFVSSRLVSIQAGDELTDLPHLCHTATMRRLKLLLICLCVGALSQALAADPPPVVSATSVASAPSTVSTPVASAAKPEDSAAARLEAQTKRLKAARYKPEVRNGVTLFCRNETQLGTRFETKICSDGDIIEKGIQDAKDVMQKVQRQNPLTSH
jgi:hypothetical protein